MFSSASVVLIGAAYILARSFGKWAGASINAKFMKCPPEGAEVAGHHAAAAGGVALGMSVTVAQTLGADGAMVRNIVLFGVLIYELVGPARRESRADRGGRYPAEGRGGRSADD